MAGNDGAAKGSLIAGGSDDDRAPPRGEVEGLFQPSFSLIDGRSKAALKFNTHAPASTHSRIAFATSLEVTLGTAVGVATIPIGSALPKIGRTNRAQPGHIAGASDPLFAHKMPATNVPC